MVVIGGRHSISATKVRTRIGDRFVGLFFPSIFVRIDLSIFIQVRLCCQIFIYVLGEECAGRGPESDLIRLVDCKKEMR
jgi:hypothetical protein